MESLYELETELFIDMIHKALEEELEDKIWQKYLAVLPHMEKEVTFNEYKDLHLKTANKNEKSDEEIFNDIETAFKINVKKKEGE